MRDNELPDDLREGIRTVFDEPMPEATFGQRDVLDGGRRRARARRGVWVAGVGAVAASALVLTALPLGSRGGTSPATDGTSTASPTPSGEVEMTGSVFDEPRALEDNGGEPFVCLGAMLLSYPPQCRPGDRVTLEGWTRPSGFQPYDDARLVGRMSGDRLDLSSVGEPAPHGEASRQLRTPCDEPPGGWVKKLSTKGLRGIDGYSHVYISYPAGGEPPADGSEPDWDALVEIPTIAVTGDVDGARAEAERIAGGPVCVVHTDHSQRDARRIARQIQEDLDLEDLPSTIGRVDDPSQIVVELPVRYDDGTLQARFDKEYGARRVVVVPMIRAVGRTPSGQE